MATMTPAAEDRPSQPIVNQSRLLGLPSETRIQIYKEVFHGLEVELFTFAAAAPRACSTLVRLCQVCRTFLVESRPIFLSTVTFVTPANVSPLDKFARVCVEDRQSLRKLVILVTKEHSRDYSSVVDFLPNMERLTIDLTPWCPGYLDVERAMKSKDTVVITDSDAEYDEDKRIGVNRLFATFEDWVKDLVLERASADSKRKFEFVVRLDFVNEPDIDGPTTIVVGSRRMPIYVTELTVYRNARSTLLAGHRP